MFIRNNEIVNHSNLNIEYEYRFSNFNTVSIGLNFAEIEFFPNLYRISYGFHTNESRIRKTTVELPVLYHLKTHNPYFFKTYLDFGIGFSFLHNIKNQKIDLTYYYEEVESKVVENLKRKQLGINTLLMLEHGIILHNYKFGLGALIRFDLDGSFYKKDRNFAQLFFKLGVNL